MSADKYSSIFSRHMETIVNMDRFRRKSEDKDFLKASNEEICVYDKTLTSN